MAQYTKIVDPNGGGNYTSLSAWEAGEQGLYSAADVALADCRRTGATKDTTGCTVSGWTAGVIPKIVVNASYRHEGKFADTRAAEGNYIYKLEVYGQLCLGFASQGGIVEGLLIKSTEDRQARYALHLSGNAAADVVVDGCILTAVSAATRIFHGIHHGNAHASASCTARNNSVYAPEKVTNGIGINAFTNGSCDFDNNTVYGFAQNIKRAVAAAGSICRNNYAGGGDTDFSSTWGTADYNVSSDASAPGPNKATGKTTYATYFAGYTTGDFHLTADSNTLWGLAGADLSGTFTTDIDGIARTVPWDIGADEFVGGSIAPPASPPPITTQTTRIGPLVQVVVTSDEDPPVWFHWWVDGVYAGVTGDGTAQSSRTFCVGTAAQERIEVVDTTSEETDPLTIAPDCYPARRALWFLRSLAGDVASYRIEQQQDGGDWTAIGTIPAANDPWAYSIVTDRLDDLADYAWRAIPIDPLGNEGDALTIAGETIVRPPDAPRFALEFDSGTARVTLSAA